MTWRTCGGVDGLHCNHEAVRWAARQAELTARMRAVMA